MDGPIRQRRFRRRTRRNILIGIIGLILIILAWYFLQNWFEQRAVVEYEARVDAAEQAAGRIATSLEEKLAAPLARLDALAEDPDVKRRFATAENGTASLPAPAADIKGLLKLRLLLPDQLQLDTSTDPPLSYASLDLLKQALDTDKRVAAELHMPGTDRAHIVMVRRVRDSSGELIGLIHASLSPAILDQALEAPDNFSGYMELKQFISGAAPVVLVAHGDAGFKQNPISHTVPIKASSWTLSYWPPGQQAGATGTIAGWLLPATGALLLLVLTGVWLVRRRRTTAPAEGASYDGAVKAFMNGAHPALAQLIPDLPRRPPAPIQHSTATAEASPMKSDTPSSANSPEIPQPESEQAPGRSAEADAAAAVTVPESIFRAYDIRGLVESELTAAVVGQLGRAIGSEARAREQKTVVVGRDGRLSSPDLAEALSRGLMASGVDVIDIGLVPTPVLYFATHHLPTTSGVMVTGSHNGPEYNGLKIVLGGETLSGDTVRALYQRIREQDFTAGNGNLHSNDVVNDYIRRATEDIPAALGNAYTIVIDAGNGVAGVIAPQVCRALGHDIIELYCDIDGRFPNHHPDPSQPENLQDLIAKVKETGADLGLAFDGDGDRLGVVTAEGDIIWPDRQLMLLARDVLSRNPGAPIIFDVKCSRYLKAIIESAGGKPLMWKTGHSFIKAKMKELKAPLAGEMSGHIFFKERWYGFDDAIYTAARLLEVLGRAGETPSAVFAELPGGIATHELRVGLPEHRHAEVMTALKRELGTTDAELVDVDGLRLDYADGWGLLRPSNTSPFLVARFEAENEAALARIQTTFREALQAVDPALEVPF